MWSNPKFSIELHTAAETMNVEHSHRAAEAMNVEHSQVGVAGMV